MAKEVKVPKVQKFPLGLPQGSVRALMALMILGGLLVSYFVHKEIPDFLMTLAGVTVTFYFTQRMNETPKSKV